MKMFVSFLSAAAALISTFATPGSGTAASPLADNPDPVIISIEVRRVPKAVLQATSATQDATNPFLMNRPAPSEIPWGGDQQNLIDPTTGRMNAVRANPPTAPQISGLAPALPVPSRTPRRNPTRILDQLSARNLGTVLARPSILLVPGTIGEVSMTSDQDLEYFVPQGNNLFELKHLNEPTGVRIKLTTQQDPDGGVFLNPLKLSLNLVESRQPLPGTSLNVGAPLITKRDSDFPIHLRPNESVVVQGSMGDDELLIEVRMETNVANRSLRSASLSRPSTADPRLTSGFPGGSIDPITERIPPIPSRPQSATPLSVPGQNLRLVVPSRDPNDPTQVPTLPPVTSIQERPDSD